MEKATFAFSEHIYIQAKLHYCFNKNSITYWFIISWCLLDTFQLRSYHFFAFFISTLKYKSQHLHKNITCFALDSGERKLEIAHYFDHPFFFRNISQERNKKQQNLHFLDLFTSKLNCIIILLRICII